VDAVNERIIGGLNARIDITKAVAGEWSPRAARAKKKMARAAAV
jgi:hypothetical protein